MAELATAPKDFAEAAILSMTTDPDVTPAPKAEVVKVDPPAPKVEKQDRGIPEGLFEKKVEGKKEEVVIESGSEIDAITEPNFRDPKNKGGWDTLKSKAKDLETKYGEAQKKLIELEAKGKSTADIEAKLSKMEQDHKELQVKAAEYEGIVKKRWIEDDPQFRKDFVDGRNDLIKRAQKIVKDSGLDHAQVEIALNLQGESRIRALAQIAEGLDNFQSARLGRVIDELDAKDEQAASLRSNPEDFLKERQERDQQRQKAETEQFQKTMSKAFRDAAQEASEKFIMARKLDGADWWNKRVEESFANAEKFWTTNNDPKAAAVRNIKAELYDAAEQGFIDMRAERDTIRSERDKMKAELEKLYGNGSPSINRGTSGSDKSGKHVDFASRVIDTAQIRA